MCVLRRRVSIDSCMIHASPQAARGTLEWMHECTSTSVPSAILAVFSHELWKTLCSCISKIISLLAPMLYCVFDRFVLLHKSPIFSVFIHISPCFYCGCVIRFVSSVVLLTVRPLKQTNTDANILLFLLSICLQGSRSWIQRF